MKKLLVIIQKMNVKAQERAKKVVLFLATLMFASTVVAQNAIYNSDDIAVINAIIENNGLNWTKANPANGSYVPADWIGVTWSDEANDKHIISLNISGYSLSGILNLSGLTMLQELLCYNNNLTLLDVSGSINLQKLYCFNNNLASLDVSKLTNLQQLYCSDNNLASLDVSKLTNLQQFDCGDNNLTSLDVSKLSKLQQLNCENNKLALLNVTGLANLQVLHCSNNNLVSLDISELINLQRLYCSSNNLALLDGSKLTNLQTLWCNDNNLASLNVSKLINLKEFWCDGNNLNSLDVSKLTNLQELSCYSNNMVSLNVSGLINLKRLNCSNNNLALLDVSGLTNLLEFNCDNNNLVSLDASELANLQQLYCGNNNLASLDISKLSNLWKLSCEANHLTVLDLTMLSNIRSFYGYDQAQTFTLTGTSGNYNANVTFSANTTFDNTALSYNNGVLTSTGNTVLSSYFTSPTGLTGRELSGTLTLTYVETGTLTPIYNPGDIAVINAIIENNGLNWTKANPADGSYVPDDWTDAAWSNEADNKRVVFLDISEHSLTGILNLSGLTYLQNLYCGSNDLVSLNISNLTDLQALDCRNNNLTSLDVPKLSYLRYFNCKNNNLVSLNVSDLTNLQEFYCSDNNLASLDVSKLTNLKALFCENNNLTSLDVSKLANLQEFWCNDNNLDLLDVSKLTKLQLLYCDNNNLTSLDVSKLTNLLYLSCKGNHLTTLDLTGFSSFRTFYGSDQTQALTLTGTSGNYKTNVTFGANPTFNNAALSYSGGVLTSTNNTALSSVFTSPTGLAGKDLTGILTLTYIETGTPTPIYNPDNIAVINTIIENNGLKWTKANPADGSYIPADWTGVTWSNEANNKRVTVLNISERFLTGVLNISELTNLKELSCDNNSLTSLDASKLTNLQVLDCRFNNLTSLDVSESTNLQYLSCYYNNLASLDVSKLTNLKELNCGYNELALLDVSKLTNLKALYCDYNNLTSLDVSGSTNLQVLSCRGNHLTVLNLTGLSNLTTFYGTDQRQTLTLTGVPGNYNANVTFNANTTFDNTALAYSNGVLTSTNNAALSSGFTSPTGLSGRDLTGTLKLTYPSPTEVNVNENEPVGNDRQGSIDVSLNIPTSMPFGGIFIVTLPKGFSLNSNSTSLAEELQNDYILDISQFSTNKWQISIIWKALGNSNNFTYQKIMNLVYDIEENIANGTYQVVISDLLIYFENGSNFSEKTIDIDITVDHSNTGIQAVDFVVDMYYLNGNIYVDTSMEELISTYSISGNLLYQLQKQAGKTNFSIENIPPQILIVKGSSGWNKKIVAY